MHANKMLLVLICGILGVTSGTQLFKNKAYIAAVVEFAPKGNPTDPAELIIATNLPEFEYFTNEVKAKGANIVVFPEYGLTTTSPSEMRELAIDFSQIVPDPEQNIIPCDTFNTSLEYATLQRLSCMAKTNGLYVVVNLIEREPCQDCADEMLLFNTNVAFSDNGTVVARYRKYNLFGETAINRPANPDYSIFEAFGKRFGLITCFDLMFRTPAVDLVQEYNVTDMIFPTAWFQELPFLTAVQAQAAWSFAYDVNFLAAGYNRPHLASTGSGIYGGLRNGAITTLMADEEGSKYLIAPVPNESKGSAAAPRKLVYNKDNLSNYHSTPLLASSLLAITSIEACHDTFCCYLTYELESTIAEEFHYQLLAYNGVRTHDAGKHPSNLQVCAVIACAFDNHTSCSEDFQVSQYSKNTTFRYLELTGKTFQNNLVVWPNTVLSDSLNPIQPYDFEFLKVSNEHKHGTYAITLKTKKSFSAIHTFAIYSHDYEEYIVSSADKIRFPYYIFIFLLFGYAVKYNL